MTASMEERRKKENHTNFFRVLIAPVRQSISSIVPDWCNRHRFARWPSTFFLPLLFCNYLMHFHCAYVIVRAIEKCHLLYERYFIKNMTYLHENLNLTYFSPFFSIYFLNWKKKIMYWYIATIFVCTVFVSLTRIKL